MRNICILLLLGSGAVLVAQDTADRSPLGRLEAETRALAQVAQPALVTLSFDDATADPARSLVDFHRRWGAVGNVHRGRSTVSGVLVGAPPKVVVPTASVGKARTVDVRFPDGATARAERIEADPDSGLVVYGLPERVASKRRGLRAEADWKRLAAGSLAVVAGEERLRLSLIRATDARLGRVDLGVSTKGVALVGTRGTLLGVRAAGRLVDTTSCVACHTAGSVGGRNSEFLTAVELARIARAHGSITFPARTVRAVKGPAPHFIPGPMIHRVVDDIEKHGRIRRAYLGVVLGDTAGRDDVAGVAVTAVLAGSPAERARLEAGQRVVRIDGLACPTSATLSRALAMHRPGDKVTLTVAGDGETRDVEVTLGNRTDAQEHLVTPESVGLVCDELATALRSYLGLEQGVRGVVVRSVRAGSAAARAGLRREDVIVWGGEGAVADLEELSAAIAGAKGALVLRGYRAGESKAWTLKLRGGKQAPR